MIVSAVGVGLAIYGRKQNRLPQFVAGLGLIVIPFFGARDPRRHT